VVQQTTNGEMKMSVLNAGSKVTKVGGTDVFVVVSVDGTTVTIRPHRRGRPKFEQVAEDTLVVHTPAV